MNGTLPLKGTESLRPNQTIKVKAYYPTSDNLKREDKQLIPSAEKLTIDIISLPLRLILKII